MRSPTNIVLFQGSHAQSHKYCSVGHGSVRPTHGLLPSALVRGHFKNVFKRVGVELGRGGNTRPLLDFNILQFL